MIIIMKKEATEDQVTKVYFKIKNLGLTAQISKGEERSIVGVIGDLRKVDKESFKMLPGVEKIISILKPYKLASREFKPHDTVIDVKGVKIGGNEIVVMAGPCAIENEEILLDAAKKVKAAGAKILRGSAYKPRTSPYAFQGLGEEGLKIMKKVGKKTGLVTETEVMDVRNVELVSNYVDIVRIGTRNMQNFDLLKEVGKIKNPIILKRGMSATIEELLMSAEYIMSEGNHNVILCERGIRTFETSTRNTLDLSAIPVLKELSHLPVIVDPSHSSGKRNLVLPMSRAAIAAGADGLIIEVHPKPEEALCDGPQQILPDQFSKLMKELNQIAKAIGRKI